MTPGSSELDDLKLVARIQAGETDLFRVLIERHQKSVYALGRSFFRNEEDALDFVQEVFLKAYRSLTSFEGRSRFSTWLYRVAYNTAINTRERRKEFQSLAEGHEESDDESPEVLTLRENGRAAIRKAIDELPDRYRVCLDLFFFYDLSYPEIAVVTGFPVNTIKSHVFRAKTLLRDSLSDIAEGGMP